VTLPDIPRQSTRLTVFRTTESTQDSSQSATVSIDGTEFGSCEFAGYQTFDVRAGSHVLTVYTRGGQGRCSLSIVVLGGEEYFYEISPRKEYLAAFLLGTVIGAFGGGLGPLIGPSATMGAESSGKACGGPFSIVDVDEDAARRKLKDLRKSR
jgi:hypothetical protein